MREEKVLVVPTDYFRKLGYFQGFTQETERYIPNLLEESAVVFLQRAEAERDPSWKQLIPYMIFRCQNADGEDCLFRYTRGKGMGEGRLHLKHSIGVGGHLSEEDCQGAANKTEAYTVGMLRERMEEVRIETEILSERIVGLINDDETEVGQVHLGVVHLIDVAEPNVFPNEKDVLETGFYPVKELLLNLDGYETWSSITLEAMWKRADS